MVGLYRHREVQGRRPPTLYRPVDGLYYVAEASTIEYVLMSVDPVFMDLRASLTDRWTVGR